MLSLAQMPCSSSTIAGSRWPTSFSAAPAAPVIIQSSLVFGLGSTARAIAARLRIKATAISCLHRSSMPRFSSTPPRLLAAMSIANLSVRMTAGWGRPSDDHIKGRKAMPAACSSGMMSAPASDRRRIQSHEAPSHQHQETPHTHPRPRCARGQQQK